MKQQTNWYKFLEFVMGVDPEVFKFVKDQKKQSKKRSLDRDAKLKALIELEAEIGGEVFGPAQPDEERRFYCLDERTWVYQNDYTDLMDGKKKQMIIRYELHPNGVLKIVNGKTHSMVQDDEAERLIKAIELYSKRVMSELYTKNS